MVVVIFRDPRLRLLRPKQGPYNRSGGELQEAAIEAAFAREGVEVLAMSPIRSRYGSHVIRPSGPAVAASLVPLPFLPASARSPGGPAQEHPDHGY